MYYGEKVEGSIREKGRRRWLYILKQNIQCMLYTKKQFFNIVSWNINGCGTPVKGKKYSLIYYKMRSCCIFQETHLQSSNTYSAGGIRFDRHLETQILRNRSTHSILALRDCIQTDFFSGFWCLCWPGPRLHHRSHIYKVQTRGDCRDTIGGSLIKAI